MTTLRDQEKLSGDIRPLVINVMNFNKGADGEPTLLVFDDARTLFHEFGHALHGLLSDVTYPMISGTSVLTDWVELPSQLYEHWFERPEILREFAVHYRTGEPMPEDAAPAADRGAHLQPGLRDGGICRVRAGRSRFPSAAGGREPRHRRLRAERRSTRIGMPDEIVMRHRPPHSSTSSQAAVMRRPITATCGRR